MFTKAIFVFCTFILLGTSVSVAAPTILGNFAKKHTIAFLGYADRPACEKDKYAWKDGLCMTEASDIVRVKRVGKSLNLTISTVVTNANMCDFSSAAVRTAKNEIKGAIEVDDFDPTTGAPVKVLCQVSVVYLNYNTVRVTANENCSSLCGLNASLNIESAKRE